MQNFVNFIKENYSYFVYAIEFFLAFVASVVAFLKSRRSSDLEIEKRLLSSKYSDLGSRQRALLLLPDLIYKANILYPYHGDGEKRFNYVYVNILQLSGLNDSSSLHSWVYRLVKGILDCDKVEKISRDTQEIEPKKELYETEKNASEERSQDLLQNVQKDESYQCGTCYVPRRD